MSDTTKQIKWADVEVSDYGVDHAQYFQGHGCALTPYKHAVLGCGDDFREALNDALESAAIDGFEIEDPPADYWPNDFIIQGESVGQLLDDNQASEEEREECELHYFHYYVGIRF